MHASSPAAYLVDHRDDGRGDAPRAAEPPLPVTHNPAAKEIAMRSLLLFLLGVPIPIIILIWLFT